MPSELTSNVEVRAGELFAEILANHQLPPEMTPAIFVKALISPKHYPVVQRILSLFGASSKTTYATEWHGDHLPEARKKPVASAYQKKLTELAAQQVKGDKRFWALALAHSDGNDKLAADMYTIMRKYLAPGLGYKSEMQAGAPGDYHLLFSWMAKNIDGLKALIPVDTSTNRLDRVSALIGLNGEKAVVNLESVDSLVEGWRDIIGNIDLDAATVGKPKLDPEKRKLRRVGATSVTDDFEDAFVAASKLDDETFSKVFSITNITPKIRETFNRRIGLVQLILLGTIQDIPIAGRVLQSGDLPLRELGEIAKVKLPVLLSNLQELSTTPPKERDLGMFYHGIDPDLGNQSPAEATNQLIRTGQDKVIPGYGAPQALLHAHCEAVLHGENEKAKQLTKLMLYATRIVTDAHAIQELGLDRLLWE